MFVLIGAPVYKREWILDDWFSAIERQDFPLSDIGFVFECAPDDHGTMEKLMEFQMRHPELRCFDIQVNSTVEHETHVEGKRQWMPHQYQKMATLRNNLLERVVAHSPDRYFSLDTDVILESPTTISELVKLTQTHDAVAPLMFMALEGIKFPNLMQWVLGPGGSASRRPPSTYDYGNVFRSDVIMAAVMMSKPVYLSARYYWHRQGEDLGWSADCAMKGFKLYSASHIYTPHIMSRAALARYKEIGDDRWREAKEAKEVNYIVI